MIAHFVYLAGVGHLSCICVLALDNNTAMNMRIQIPLGDLGFSSFWQKSKSEVPGSYGKVTFDFLAICSIVFHTWAPTFAFLIIGVQFLTSLHPTNTSSFLFIF